MPEKKIPWWQPQIGSFEKTLINSVLDSNYINEGELATEFERKIAELLGSRHAVVTTSGTAALFLALKSLGIRHGDEVIVPDMTFIATANAVNLTGAKPKLVDVDPKTLNVNPESVLKAINSKTKAIIPVHVTGRAADMTLLLNIAKKHNLKIVEDAAEAFMSKHVGKCLGTFGHIGCFSFSPNKTISSGQGGIAVTDDDDLALKMRKLKDQGRPKRGTGGDDIYDSVGYNFKFTNLQAAIGLGQLNYLDERVKRMRKTYEIYARELADVDELSIYPCNLKGGAVPQWTDIQTEQRDALAEYLLKNKIDSRKYWHPLHSQLAYKLPDDNFPNSIYTSPRSLWLPSAFTLTDEDVMTVCGVIKEFFKNK